MTALCKRLYYVSFKYNFGFLVLGIFCFVYFGVILSDAQDFSWLYTEITLGCSTYQMGCWGSIPRQLHARQAPTCCTISLWSQYTFCFTDEILGSQRLSELHYLRTPKPGLQARLREGGLTFPIPQLPCRPGSVLCYCLLTSPTTNQAQGRNDD